MKVSINGFGIEYSLEGPESGLPVVFIHAFPMSKEMWAPQVDALKNEYRVLTYDVRGHGQSDIGTGQYTIEFCVDDLVGLLDHLNLMKVVVVGLSMGGYIALRAIERHPDRFRAAVLCNTRSEPDTNEAKIKRSADIKVIQTLGMRRITEFFLPKFFHDRTFTTNPDIIKFAKTIIGKNNPTGVTGMLLALAARTDTTPSLAKIRMPVLLIAGEFDQLTPPAVIASIHQKIPGAVIHTVPGAAHYSNLENSEVFNTSVINFLETLS
jgi:3-oxoadipate enol-lactonase